MKIALASLPFPGTIEAALVQIDFALREAGARGARIVCTAENFLPGLRGLGFDVEAVTDSMLHDAFGRVSDLVRSHRVALVLGAEYPSSQSKPLMTALVFDQAGELVGRQEKVQLDPFEDDLYLPGSGRSLFEIAGLKFGVAICHEGWRYPETVRWAARRGAQIVFMPHLGMPTGWDEPPHVWADPRNSFHEKAAMCRAAENTIYIAAVNYALADSETTSAVINPDGTLLAHQPYGVPGILVVDIDLAKATGLLARRYVPID